METVCDMRNLTIHAGILLEGPCLLQILTCSVHARELLENNI